jgi:uncharacterized protein (UPF0147 family)
MATNNSSADDVTELPGAIEPNPEPWSKSIWSFAAVLSLDTFITIAAVLTVGTCILWILNKRAKKKEERDKIGEIIKTNYWEHEEAIAEVLLLLNKLRRISMFREITSLHVFAYKYRVNIGIFQPRDLDNGSGTSEKAAEQYAKSIDAAFKTVKLVERLFEILTLELPLKGKCPSNSYVAFGCTLHNLVHATATLWSDRQYRMIRQLVMYFCGRTSVEAFEVDIIPDEELETLVLARMPYVTQLFLNVDHFVLKDVDITNDLKIDLRNKIRYIDTVLSKDPKALEHKEKNLIESYYAARELCLKNNFILNKNHLPDLICKMGEPSKITECVSLLQHLLRTICMPKNLRKVETDDKYFQFLMQLHETLYTWSDAGTMMEVIERTRNNIFSYLRGFSPEQMLIDKEFTKAKLEHLEKELYRHLNYLTLRQVQESKERRGLVRQRTDPTVGASIILDPKMRSFDSESSVYTMAMSASSFLMQRQPQPGPSHDPDAAQKHELLAAQRSLDPCSIDQASIVSGSSLYATAASISSGPNESTPLMCPSPSSSQQQQQQRREMVDRAQSPMSSADSDFYETAV